MQKIYLDTEKELITEQIKVTGNTKYMYVCKLTNKESRTLRVDFLFDKVDTHAQIVFKVVLFDKSSFDFEGVLKINKGAKNTNAYLKVDCLLLSERASARVVPSLEINEDEVKASHGATIGCLEPTMLNYLKSKGLSYSESEKVLVDAFLTQ